MRLLGACWDGSTFLGSLQEHGEDFVTKLTMQEELLSCVLLVAFHECALELSRCILLWKLLWVVDRGLIVGGWEYLPSLGILWVDLSGLQAMINNLLIVTIREEQGLLVWLHVLELPECELLMADTKEIRFNILWIDEQIVQDLLRLLEWVLVSLGSSLVVQGIRDSNIDSGQVIDQLLLFLLDYEYALVSLLLLFLQLVVLCLVQFFLKLEKHFLA